MNILKIPDTLSTAPLVDPLAVTQIIPRVHNYTGRHRADAMGDNPNAITVWDIHYRVLDELFVNPYATFRRAIP